VVEGAAVPLGAYPHLVQVGSTVYVSGTSSRRPDDTVAGAELSTDGTTVLDIRVQTAAVLERIDSLLATVGGGLADLVQVTTFLVSMADFPGYNEVYGRYMTEGGAARTTVAVSELPHPDLLIEIQAVAHVRTDPKETP
jgi:2-aminomuconate deaminase